MNAEFELVRRGQREPIGRDALASRRIPRELHDLRASARSFEIDDELANAVNVALAVGAFACAHVAPYEREDLAKPAMTPTHERNETAFRSHVHDSREGATGGSGSTGAGCGCN